jgi:hypothetical protein
VQREDVLKLVFERGPEFLQIAGDFEVLVGVPDPANERVGQQVATETLFEQIEDRRPEFLDRPVPG